MEPMSPLEQLLALQRQLVDMQRQLDNMQQTLSLVLEQLKSAPVSAPHTPPLPVTPGRADLSASRICGPLYIRGTSGSETEQVLLANGIDGSTGQLLLKVALSATRDMIQDDPDNPLSSTSQRGLHRAKQHQYRQHLGPVFGVDEDNLAACRWAVVVNADDDAQVIKALMPLIQQRSMQQGTTLPDLTFHQGERCGEWLVRYLTSYPPEATREWAEKRLKEWHRLPPVLIYQPGESCSDWLARHYVAQGPVDTLNRVLPFYLMLVGRPGPIHTGDTTSIPFDFQYELDMFWGVGRLCFTDTTNQHILDAYTAYAEQVVACEQQESNPPYQPQALFFGTLHDTDLATQQSMQQLIQPLTDDANALVRRWGFDQQLLLARDATRANLERALCGKIAGDRPTLLFSATHGVGFPPDDARLLMHQGALVCQDWTGFGNITREHYFAGEDLPDQTNVQGLIAVCFACFGAGCPQEDQFIFTENRVRPQIAPYPLVAQLPQQLLRRGALAVLGHVERAWSYSFSSPTVPAQTQSFEDLLGRIMAGKRMGFATDQFNLRQGVLSSQVADAIERTKHGRVLDASFSLLWMARNDARNYALLGDPAVRLPWHSQK